MKFKEILCSLRKNKNLSQEELSKETGITRSAIGMYETGKREPDIETIKLFARYFGVDMNTILGQNNEFPMIYDRIRMRRIELGMSQDDLAKKLGYKTRSAIAKIEAGENDVSSAKLCAIAKVLNVSSEYLLNGSTSNQEAVAAKENEEFNRLFGLLYEDEKEIIIAAIKGILKRHQSEPNIENVGNRIKFLRKQQGLTLEEIGQRVGVGKSTVRKWEEGDIQNMRCDKIPLLADALDTTPEYIMGWNTQRS